MTTCEEEAWGKKRVQHSWGLVVLVLLAVFTVVGSTELHVSEGLLRWPYLGI